MWTLIAVFHAKSEVLGADTITRAPNVDNPQRIAGELWPTSMSTKQIFQVAAKPYGLYKVFGNGPIAEALRDVTRLTRSISLDGGNKSWVIRRSVRTRCRRSRWNDMSGRNSGRMIWMFRGMISVIVTGRSRARKNFLLTRREGLTRIASGLSRRRRGLEIRNARFVIRRTGLMTRERDRSSGLMRSRRSEQSSVRRFGKL